MKQLDIAVFVAVFQEMLGWAFWPLVAFVVIGAAALLVIVLRDRGIDPRRLVRSEIVGLAGGFVGIWIMLTVTDSRLGDIGGPIDWVLVIAIWVAGAIGATIVAYVLQGLLARTAQRAG